MGSLSLQKVTAGYNGVQVVRGVDLEVQPGEWVALIGPNGAGKSTLLKAVTGTIPWQGEIVIGGTPARSLRHRDIARLVAMVPQHPMLPEQMPVFDYVLLGRTPYIPYWGMEGADDLSRVDEVLDRLGLIDVASRPVGALSGGELQQVVLARALAQNADVLLLDEPTTSLDVGHQQHVMELVDDLRREQEIAVLSAVHDLTLAGQYADRLVLIAEGRVVAHGTPDEVLTEETLAVRYQADVVIVRDPDAGLVVVPRRRAQEPTNRSNPTPTK
jgi:iron complex transport system ATP-binding protein